MKNLFLFVLISIFLFACKPTPTHNPFDDVFDVSVHQLIEEGCDTVNAGCGYVNFITRRKKFRTYYQVYGGDSFYKAVAKGFDYSMDTFQIPSSKVSDTKYIDSLIQKPFDFSGLEFELSQFDYHFFTNKGGLVVIGDGNSEKRIDVAIRHDFIEALNEELPDTVHFMRYLNYFNSDVPEKNEFFDF
jgi:hypothetical protein